MNNNKLPYIHKKLPYIHKKIQKKDFLLNFTDNINELKPVINNSLYSYIQNAKLLIAKNDKEWDTYKKYTNPYEFIHTHYDSKNYVSKIKPLSRAYFKMIEICNMFELIDDKPHINSFHLAEGPGGFIEAIVRLRNNKNDKYYGITLQNSSNEDVPGWKKSQKFLNNNPNVYIENGIDNTGNIYNIENYEYIYNNFANSMDIITGDGGFDFSVDYSKQEHHVLRLLLTQVIYAISLQKKDGSFILKIFDIFIKPSIDIIYLLSCFYEDVYIYKPYTSRFGNSEKYIICKKFKSDNIEYIYDTFYNIIQSLVLLDYNNLTIKNILNIEIPIIYKNHLIDINAIYGQQQIETINNTFMLIQNNNKIKDKLETYKKNNIQKCIQWCINNNIPYNNYNKYNVFLNKKVN
jgi:23S rRNA U2552 (ribose-2'-O)-methylase RlmE/FtsJ